MGIFKTLANVSIQKSSEATHGLGRSISGNAISTVFGTGGSPVNVLEEYNGFAWKCINIRATVLSSEDLFVEILKGDKWFNDETHEFNDVLEGDNGRRDLSEMLEAHSRSMDLYGEAFWYFSKGERSNKPFALYLLDPSSMTVMVKRDMVTGYVYNKDGNRVLFDVDEIMHRRIEDPRSPFRGYGPMQAAGWFVKAARYTTVYVNNFLENNAIPAGVVVANGDVANDDWELFKKEWKSRYGGIDNVGKTGFVRGSSLDFVKTGLSLGDIDIEKMKNTNRDDVMVMFGISKPMMAIFDDINRASAVTARELFAITFTKPELKAITRKLTKKVRNWYGKQYRVASTNPVPEDEESKLNVYDKGVGRWFTVNEARAAYGQPPIEGGDVIQREVKAQPAEGNKSFLVKKATTRVVMKVAEPKTYYQKIEALRDKYNGELEKALAPIMRRQRDKQIAGLKVEKSYIAQPVAEDEVKSIVDESIRVLIEMAADQKILSLAELGSDAAFDITDDWKTLISDALYKATRHFVANTQEIVTQVVLEAIQAGESHAAIAKRIHEAYKELDPSVDGWRLKRFTRTETIRANNAAATLTYEHEGVEYIKWRNNPGACQYCQKMNNVEAKLHSAFLVDGDTIATDEGTHNVSYGDIQYPPLHPNCECYIVAVRD